MKKGLLLLSILALTAISTFGQGFNYQTVLRNGGSAILTNQNVDVQFDIVQGSESGIIVYSEKHDGATSNEFGVLSLVVGEGVPTSGTFASIDWSSGSYYLKVTLGTDVMGAAKLNAVPFASYADKAGSVASADVAGNLNIAGAASGDLLHYDGTKWTKLAKGADGKVLSVTAGNLAWADDAIGGGIDIAGATTGDLVFYDGAEWTRLAKGANGKVLSVTAGALTWEDDAVGGGIDIAGASAGDVIYHNGTDWVRMPKGTDGQVLTLAAGVPSWADAATGGASEPKLGDAYSDGIIMAIYPNGDVLVVKDEVIMDGGFNTVLDYTTAQASLPAGFRLPTHREISTISTNAIYLSSVWSVAATFWTSTSPTGSPGAKYLFVVGNGFFNSGTTDPLFGTGSGEVVAVKKVPYL